MQEKKHYQKHKQKILKRQKEYRIKNKDIINERVRKARSKNRDLIHKRNARYNLKIKTEVMTNYGNGRIECSICGEKRMGCLSIDHINGGGTKHRREIGIIGGMHFYYWLRKNNFPLGYRVLCMNCQFLYGKRPLPRPGLGTEIGAT